MRGALDPYGAHNPLVDKMIGNAFTAVKYVAHHIKEIVYVAKNMEHIFKVAKSLDKIGISNSGYRFETKEVDGKIAFNAGGLIKGEYLPNNLENEAVFVGDNFFDLDIPSNSLIIVEIGLIGFINNEPHSWFLEGFGFSDESGRLLLEDEEGEPVYELLGEYDDEEMEEGLEEVEVKLSIEQNKFRLTALAPSEIGKISWTAFVDLMVVN